MLWKNEECKEVKSFTIYKVEKESVFFIPDIVFLKVKTFESSFERYLNTKIAPSLLLLEMYSIYGLYKKEGGVNIKSTQNKSLKERHEKFIIEYMKQNLEHTKQLETYF